MKGNPLPTLAQLIENRRRNLKMATKAVRVDEEVIQELLKRGEDKTPNQVIREILGLPERKYIKKKIAGDHISKAHRYMLKAIQELSQAKEEVTIK